MLERGPRALQREEPALAERLLTCCATRASRSSPTCRPTASAWRGDGARAVHAGERSWTAEELFVGAGRMPNVEGLGLEGLGVRIGDGGVAVDDRLRTSVKSIYAAAT